MKGGGIKSGFTLAEVLITLSIIGVVAALTIPSLTKKFEKQEWIARYKQTYSIISQATSLMKANNGGTLAGLWGDGDKIAMARAYEPFLKITKNCIEQGRDNVCTPDKSMTLENSVVLSNGAVIGFFMANAPDNKYSYPNIIFIDTNGKKGPNEFGKDFHQLIFYSTADSSKQVFMPPFYSTENDIVDSCPDDLNYNNPALGGSCGIRILRGDYGLKY